MQSKPLNAEFIYGNDQLNPLNEMYSYKSTRITRLINFTACTRISFRVMYVHITNAHRVIYICIHGNIILLVSVRLCISYTLYSNLVLDRPNILSWTLRHVCACIFNRGSVPLHICNRAKWCFYAYCSFSYCTWNCVCHVKSSLLLIFNFKVFHAEVAGYRRGYVIVKQSPFK